VSRGLPDSVRDGRPVRLFTLHDHTLSTLAPDSPDQGSIIEEEDAMSTRFSQQLNHFARSIDIVDADTAGFVKDLLHQYMSKIGVHFYIVLLDGLTIDNGPGLGTFATGHSFWSMDGIQLAIPVRRENQGHHSLTSYAYDLKKPLWVVEKSGGTLKADEGTEPVLEDHWSGRTQLPPFGDLGNLGTARTLIAVPLSHAYRVFGVLSVQFNDQRLPTEATKQEFQNIAEAIAVVISLYQVRQAQIADTTIARNPLHDVLQDQSDSPFVKPRLFLAYSESADPEVLAEIRSALEPYHDAVEIEDWQRNFDPGEINKRLGEAITSCRYAICYFSEPSESVETPYRDNLNVLVEAGMFYSLALCAAASCQGWIPVREETSPSPPFDLASVNTIRVKRPNGENGPVLDRDTLRTDLQNYLGGLIQR
jgi:hypothetical protein